MDPEAVPDVGRAHHGGAGEGDVLDLSANVNPRTPAGVRDVYEEALEPSRRYGGAPIEAYRTAAAERVGCDSDGVVPTAGGSGAIRLAVASLVGRGETALVPAPSFAEYAREVRLQGGEPAFYDPEDLGETRPDGAALAVVCTPNNPTGWLPDPAALEAFVERCRAAGTPVLVDEAFLGFTDGESLAGEPGTVVARTLTKLYGLPGLRAGYAVATGDLGERLSRARPPWPIGTPAAAVGAHCLRDDRFVTETRERIARERERLRRGLAAHAEVAPSAAPFVCVDLGDRDVDAVLAATRQRGIVLRDARTFRGLQRHVRIAVRDGAPTDRVLAVLPEVLAGV